MNLKSPARHLINNPSQNPVHGCLNLILMVLQRVSQTPDVGRDVEKGPPDQSNVMIVLGVCLVRMSLILARNVTPQVVECSSQSDSLRSDLCCVVFEVLKDNVRDQ